MANSGPSTPKRGFFGRLFGAPPEPPPALFPPRPRVEEAEPPMFRPVPRPVAATPPVPPVPAPTVAGTAPDPSPQPPEPEAAESPPIAQPPPEPARSAAAPTVEPTLLPSAANLAHLDRVAASDPPKAEERAPALATNASPPPPAKLVPRPLLPDEQQVLADLRQLVATQRLEEASELCESYFGARPEVQDSWGHPIYLKESMRIALANGDVPRARAFAAEMEPSLSKTDPAIHVLFARYFAGAGDLARATEAWTAVLARAPNLAEARNWLAKHSAGVAAPYPAAGDQTELKLLELRRLYAAGDFRGASQICDAVFKSQPDHRDSFGHPVYFKESLRLALKSGNLPRARQMAAQFKAAIADQDPAVHVLLARHFSTVGDIAEARTEWQAVLTRDPKSEEAQAALLALGVQRARRPIAVLTMVYDEPDFLPLWLRYYGAQVGLENCFVIDHGSDDGSTNALPVGGTVRLPRTEFDERQRVGAVQDFCSGLLQYYEAVAYTDIDEFLVPDPRVYTGLIDYCGRPDVPLVTTSLGVNLVHMLGEEPDLDPELPILNQRSWGLAAANMCKPSIIRRRVTWSPGFHSYDGDVAFHGLVNFHLAYADLPMAQRRQEKRRRAVVTHPYEQHHHKQSDEWVLKVVQGWSGLDRVDPTLLSDCPIRTAFELRIVESQAGREGDKYRINLAINEGRLWHVPERFRDAL